MKKINGVKICNFVSTLLLIGFVINTIFDYIRYSTALTSAPFYIFVIVNAIYFLLPAIIVFIVGALIKKKAKKEKQN